MAKLTTPESQAARDRLRIAASDVQILGPHDTPCPEDTRKARQVARAAFIDALAEYTLVRLGEEREL